MSNNQYVDLHWDFVKNSLGKELNNAVPIFLSGSEFTRAVSSLRNSAMYGRWYFSKAPTEVTVVGSTANTFPYLVFALLGKVVAVISLVNPSAQENPGFDILFDEVYLAKTNVDAVSTNVIPGSMTFEENANVDFFLQNVLSPDPLVVFFDDFAHTAAPGTEATFSGMWEHFNLAGIDDNILESIIIFSTGFKPAQWLSPGLKNVSDYGKPGFPVYVLYPGFSAHTSALNISNFVLSSLNAVFGATLLPLVYRKNFVEGLPYRVGSIETEGRFLVRAVKPGGVEVFSDIMVLPDRDFTLLNVDDSIGSYDLESLNIKYYLPSGFPVTGGVAIPMSVVNDIPVLNADYVVLGKTASPSLAVTSNTVSPSGVRTQEWMVGNNVTVGDIYRFTIYSYAVSVVAVLGDTATSIATKAKNAVNATTAAQWNTYGSAPHPLTPGFKPVGNSLGAYFNISLNGSNVVTVAAIIGVPSFKLYNGLPRALEMIFPYDLRLTAPPDTGHAFRIGLWTVTAEFGFVLVDEGSTVTVPAALIVSNSIVSMHVSLVAPGSGPTGIFTDEFGNEFD